MCLLTCACGANPNLLRHPAAPASFPAPDVAITPVDRSTDVRLDKPVTVTSFAGALYAVAVHTNHDERLPGRLSDNHRAWTSTVGLEPATRYLVDVVADGPHGDVTTAETSFTTMAADRLTTDVTPADGDVVGVGMPITLRFNADIPSERQAAFLSHVTVQSTPPVSGSWHWFRDNEVHWRPADFWPSGTHVTVTANLRGIAAADGVWGFADWTSSFTVGPKHLSLVDVATHEMQVFENDQLIETWPISAGRASLPTISGTLYVPYKSPDVLMDSLTLGIPRKSPDGYYEHVFWNTAISVDGFYVHAAPWSEGQQGFENVSHGCVNLSTDRAITFFNWSQVGDVVVVKNSSRVADYGDGEGDWQIPSDQFSNSGGSVAVPDIPHHPGGI